MGKPLRNAGTFGWFLEGALAESGFSYVEFARQLTDWLQKHGEENAQISEDAVGTWVKDKRLPSAELGKAIAGALVNHMEQHAADYDPHEVKSVQSKLQLLQTARTYSAVQKALRNKDVDISDAKKKAIAGAVWRDGVRHALETIPKGTFHGLTQSLVGEFLDYFIFHLDKWELTMEP